MNRSDYFNFIQNKLSILATSIEMRGGLNILDHHLHSEYFYFHFLNLIFGWKLENLNTLNQNATGIDLIDNDNRIIAQVSATATKQKIESSLSKDLSAYKRHTFKFISISKDANNLRSLNYLNPHNLSFNPKNDIYDIPSLLKLILAMDIEHQKKIYEFLKSELKNEPDPEKFEYNLTTIIKILSKEDWRQGDSSFEIEPFEVEAKITENQLNKVRPIIEEYMIFYSRIDKIYSDFDKQGANKSLSILNCIRSEYLKLESTMSSDQKFLVIIEKIIQKIKNSANFTPIPEEELELCVQVLVVDAFIRCKIFKNPLGVTNAHS